MIRQFVSLYFSQSSLQIIHLDSNKKVCLIHESIAIPVGIIEQYHVKDVQALARLLKDAWTKFGIKEKNVGIIIPEFSTFVKSFSVPKLKVEELAEAVNWRISEIVPADSVDVVMDWKIVTADGNNQEILAVAIVKEILSGYIDSVGLAGLFPIVVETPSLSLTRISDHNPSGKLVIYTAKDEALIIIAHGDQIFGSSVCGLNEQELIRTSVAIVDHYNQVKVERVVLGGIGITQHLFDQLESQFKVKPEWVHTEISGIDVSQIQEYLIPISLQYKDPKEPRDEYSINLLPIEWVNKYKEKANESKGITFTAILTLIILVGFSLSLASYVFMQLDENGLKNTKPVSAQTLSDTVTKQVISVNNQSKKVTSLLSDSFYPQVVFGKISSLAPSGVVIKHIKLSFETADITVNGTSSTRSILVDFKKKLDSDPDLADATLPLSNLVTDKDINFEIRVKYKPAQKTDSNSIVNQLTIPLTPLP